MKSFLAILGGYLVFFVADVGGPSAGIAAAEDAVTLDPSITYQTFSDWEATAQAGQEFPAFGTFGPVPTAAGNAAYVSDATENSIVDGVYGLGFVLNAVPASQQSGPYSTTLHIQLHDGV